MVPFEWLAFAYAAFFGLAAFRPTPGARRLTAFVVAIVTMGLVAAASRAPEGLRLFAPNLYLIAGYWLPALCVPAMLRARNEPTSFERWLIRSDAVLRPRMPSVPAALLMAAETAYLLCYPIVPLSMALVWMHGGATAVSRFWLTLLASGFACYASLPWLVSRPPRASGEALPPAAVRRLNTYVLARASHDWTTFPSGHVAVSWAAALATARVWPEAGVGLAVIALGVSVGAAAGRYHYVIDVWLGVVVGLAAVVIT